jgi:hypothetical protein
MTIQLEISLHERENNRESETIFENNQDHFKSQCERILKELQKGKRLTVREMYNDLEVGDPRARIRDLRRTMVIKDTILKGKFKEYYL